MRERPILMSGPMVRAILAGAKTQTRRPVKPQPLWVTDPSVPFKTPDADSKGIIACPFGQPGDRLWVRETWAIRDCGRRVSLSPEAWADGFPLDRLQYPATDEAPCQDKRGNWFWWNLRPSIHMPRWACRLVLEIVSVRVERLEDIAEEGARAEGFESRDEFMEAFRAIYKLPPDANSWVWVVEFKRVEAAV